MGEKDWEIMVLLLASLLIAIEATSYMEVVSYPRYCDGEMLGYEIVKMPFRCENTSKSSCLYVPSLEAWRTSQCFDDTITFPVANSAMGMIYTQSQENCGGNWTSIEAFNEKQCIQSLDGLQVYFFDCVQQIMLLCDSVGECEAN